MANQLNSCVCALANSLTGAPRNALISMLQTLKALLTVAKTQAALVNVDWANQSKLYGLQFALQAYQTTAQPYIAPIKGVKNMLTPFIDCDVNQTVMRILNQIELDMLAPVKELQQEIMALENEIDSQDRKIKWFQDQINFIDDFVETIQNGCTTP